MHTSKNSMWREIWKNLQFFFELNKTLLRMAWPLGGHPPGPYEPKGRNGLEPKLALAGHHRLTAILQEKWTFFHSKKKKKNDPFICSKKRKMTLYFINFCIPSKRYNVLQISTIYVLTVNFLHPGDSFCIFLGGFICSFISKRKKKSRSVAHVYLFFV